MSTTSYYGTLLSLGVAAVVTALLYWQWAERRGRGDSPSDDDRAHFRTQDVRRGAVAAVMAALAVSVFLGSRVPYRVGGRPNVVFVGLWLGVFGLVLVLLGLALADWLATRNYALRHRGEIVREGLDILRDEIRSRTRHTTNGRSGEEFHRSPDGEEGRPG